MILDDRDEQDLLHAMSLIRRVLAAHGVGKDIPASITRQGKEYTSRPQHEVLDVRDDVPDDSQIDRFSEQ